jgi:ABC-type phosphate transport system auxiliary subunit
MKLRKENTMTVPFDTLAYAKKLEAGGVAVKQAEAHAASLAEVLEKSFTPKKDWGQLIIDLDQSVTLLRNDMDTKIDARFTVMDTKLNELRTEIDTKFTVMDTKLNELRTEIDTKFSVVDTKFFELRTEMDARFTVVDIKFSELRTEMDARFNVMDTKFNELRTEMYTKFGELRAEMNGKFLEVKSDVIKWVFGISFAQAALIVSLLKFFH